MHEAKAAHYISQQSLVYKRLYWTNLDLSSIYKESMMKGD